ncbi:MAG: RNA methyltransferase [Eubacterium sp.]|nr:RNA methyltransferase [Eubacterium sp.]
MITSNDNAAVKHLSLLLKKTKARKESGTYIVEGIRMFREVPEDIIEKIYVSESFAEKNSDTLSGRDYEIMSDKVFSHVSDTVTPQGIMAVVKMKKHTLEDMFPKNEEPFIVLIDGLQDPGNLGTIIRCGEAAGISGVIMSRDTVDIYNPKTVRSTMGSLLRVPHMITDDIAALAEDLKKRGFTVVATELGAEKNYDEVDYRKPTAIFIGNEGNGLSKEALDAANERIIIPMCGKVESLNAAIAASVCMYEARRQRRNV